MICDRCKKNEATFHFHESKNGQVRDIHLCGACAAELGYSNLLSGSVPFVGMTPEWQDFLGSLFSQAMPENGPKTKVCSFCGTTFEEFTKNAMAGCPHCYRAFYKELLPSIERIHGKTHHVGKIPRSASEEVVARRRKADRVQRVTALQHKLDEAVAVQAYEEAARLRDEIKAVKQEDKPQ